MTDLVSRLLAAIEQAERIALASRDYMGDGPWSVGRSRGSGEPYVKGEIAAVCALVDEASAEHIAHNDPAAVLRRCAADRELVEKYREIVAESDRVIERGYAEPDEMVSERLAFEWAIKNCAAGYGISVEEETT